MRCTRRRQSARVGSSPARRFCPSPPLGRAAAHLHVTLHPNALCAISIAACERGGARHCKHCRHNALQVTVRSPADQRAARQLTRLCAAVTCASSAREAVGVLESTEPDTFHLILTVRAPAHAQQPVGSNRSTALHAAAARRSALALAASHSRACCVVALRTSFASPRIGRAITALRVVLCRETSWNSVHPYAICELTRRARTSMRALLCRMW